MTSRSTFSGSSGNLTGFNIEAGYANLGFDSFSEATFSRPREWYVTLGTKF
jgi:hypothetical protein